MTGLELPLDVLLQPISDDRPAGADMVESDEWFNIKEARRFEDLLNRGQLDTGKAPKKSDWPRVIELASNVLSHKSKDLRLAVWLTEAAVQLYGFSALKPCFDLLTALVTQFWDKGLFPEMDSRSKAMLWLSNEDKLALQLRLLPLTARKNGGTNYSLADFEQAVALSFDANSTDPEKKRQREAAIKSGAISREVFEQAVKETDQEEFVGLEKCLSGASAALKMLNQELNDRMADDAPAFGTVREVVEACLHEVTIRIAKAPAPQEAAGTGPADSALQNLTFKTGEENLDAYSQGRSSWSEAERLIAEGKVSEGLASMTQLAAAEHGRARFMRRLRLAEVCLAANRKRLAIAVLEDLAGQIEQGKLHEWESAEVIARVWGRLGRSYRGTEKSERGRALLDQLCKLDPWQALKWDDQP